VSTKNLIQTDLSDRVIFSDPVTKQIVRTEMKNIQGAKEQEGIGKNTADARDALFGVESQTDVTLDTIEKIRNHPGLPYAIGFVGIVPPILATDQKGAINLINQAKGQAFTAAIQSLKGLGSATEMETRAATEAYHRMDRATKREEYLNALADFEKAVMRGRLVARRRAGLKTDDESYRISLPSKPQGSMIPGGGTIIGGGAGDVPPPPEGYTVR
jgi:hypothetical protein